MSGVRGRRFSKHLARAYAPKIRSPNPSRSTDISKSKVLNPHLSFFMRILNVRNHAFEWYKIEVNQTQTQTQEPREFAPILSGTQGGSGVSVILGSYLYLFGGYLTSDKQSSDPCMAHREMHILDINSPQQGFYKGPRLIKKRATTYPAIMGGKIYLFGGFETCHRHPVEPDPFGEYFDPKVGLWHALSQPPEPFLNEFLLPSFVFPFDEENIAVGDSNTCCKDEYKVLLYNTVKDSWMHLNSPISLARGHGQPVYVAGTLYWIHGLLLHAYDLNKHKSYSTPIKGSRLVHDTPAVPLLHLGGNDFCFIHIVCKRHISIVYCTQFQVFKGNKGLSDAKVFSTQSYVVDGLAVFDCGAFISDYEKEGIELRDVLTGWLINNRAGRI